MNLRTRKEIESVLHNVDSFRPAKNSLKVNLFSDRFQSLTLYNQKIEISMKISIDVKLTHAKINDIVCLVLL